MSPPSFSRVLYVLCAVLATKGPGRTPGRSGQAFAVAAVEAALARFGSGGGGVGGDHGVPRTGARASGAEKCTTTLLRVH